MTQWVYSFGGDRNEGSAEMRNLLGGKGANLAEMASIGLPVPPGFTITTEVCTAYYENGADYPDELRSRRSPTALAAHRSRPSATSFGDPDKPLLVSVRSGARVSMPGMMDTVLNLGLNDETVEGLAAASGDARFAWDSYRRFIQMYGRRGARRRSRPVRGSRSRSSRTTAASTSDTELAADDWQARGRRLQGDGRRGHRASRSRRTRTSSSGARSAPCSARWMNRPRQSPIAACTTSRTTGAPRSTCRRWCSATWARTCATGVAFTRDPSTGENVFYGEFLINAQGEDVVAGIRTPQHLDQGRARRPGADDASHGRGDARGLRRAGAACATPLERHYRDMQDIEFTVERGKLWMLQTRTGKRTAKAALKIAVDMAREGLIDEARGGAARRSRRRSTSCCTRRSTRRRRAR